MLRESKSIEQGFGDIKSKFSEVVVPKIYTDFILSPSEADQFEYGIYDYSTIFYNINFNIKVKLLAEAIQKDFSAARIPAPEHTKLAVIKQANRPFFHRDNSIWTMVVGMHNGGTPIASSDYCDDISQSTSPSNYPLVQVGLSKGKAKDIIGNSEDGDVTFMSGMKSKWGECSTLHSAPWSTEKSKKAIAIILAW